MLATLQNSVSELFSLLVQERVARKQEHSWYSALISGLGVRSRATRCRSSRVLGVVFGPMVTREIDEVSKAGYSLDIVSRKESELVCLISDKESSGKGSKKQL